MVDDGPQSTLSELTSAKEVLLSICFAAYIFLTVIYLLPSSEGKKRIFEELGCWWEFWGLEQNWALFSPEIRSINYHTTAVVTFADGTKLVWQAPRMDKLGILDRFRYEKFRKWGIDAMPWITYKDFWVDTARYVGRQFYCAENIPVSFSLQLHWIEIPKPENNLPDRNALPEHTKTNTVFSYTYLKQDFQQ